MDLITKKKLILLHANNKRADQPAHLHGLICAFIIGFLESIIAKLELVSVAEQAGLSLTWLRTPKSCFLVSRPNILSC